VALLRASLVIPDAERLRRPRAHTVAACHASQAVHVIAPIDWSDPDVWATLGLLAVWLLVYLRRALRYLDDVL
jgi:hypothetical protein